MADDGARQRTARFDFTKFVVLESLEDTEWKTGRQIANWFEQQLDARGHPIPVEYVQCDSFRDFLQEASRLKDEALAGQIPIVHIECHGAADAGLEFANGSELSWNDLAEALLQINLPTQFNTLVVVSACFGAYFVSMLSAIRASPCWGVVAPTHTILPDEIELGFKAFYGELIESWDLSSALTALKKRQLVEGDWFGELAEDWFAKIFFDYIERECRIEHSQSRVASLRTQLEAAGAPWISAHDLLRQLKLAHSQALSKYFARYFSTGEDPGIEQRFAALKAEMDQRLRALASTGNYLL